MNPKHCRICYKTDNDDLISVQLVQNNVSIAQMVLAVSGVMVTSDRRLPQNICLLCLDHLKIAFALRQQCISTDAQLREELRCSGNSPNAKLVDNASDIFAPVMDSHIEDQNQQLGILENNEERLDDEELKADTCNEQDERSDQATEMDSIALWREDVHYIPVKAPGFFCCGCTKRFNSRAGLKLHAIRKHRQSQVSKKNNSLFCSVCYLFFSDQKTLDSHLRDAKAFEQFNMFECLVCSNIAIDKKELIDHLELHKIDTEQTLSSETGSGACQRLQQISIEIEPTTSDTIPLGATNVEEETDIMSEWDSEQDEYTFEISICDDSSSADKEQRIKDDNDEKKKSLKDLRKKPLKRQDMCPPGKTNFRIVLEEEGYFIVELLQHRCCCCSKMFNTKKQLQEHLQKRLYANKKPDPFAKYVCEYCGKQFKYSLEYVCHKRLREQRQFYMCRLCNTLLDSETRMKSHMLLSDEHANYFKLSRASITDRYESVAIAGRRCCCCRQYFQDTEEMIKHVSDAHVRDDSSGHEKNDKNVKQPYACSICDQRFSTKLMVKCHLQQTKNVMQYYCKLCDFETRNKKRMELHLYSGIHRDTMPSSVELKPLQNNARKLPRLQYCCFEDCKIPFRALASLQQHVRDTHLEMFQANKRESADLVNVLPSTKHFVCDVCSLSFKNPTALRCHKAQGTRQHCVCPICGVKKRSRAILIIHQRSHTGERPYNCEFCDKSFASKTTLSSHLKCHNTRQYTCEVCGEKFNRTENLKRHTLLKHGEATLQCGACPKKFKTMTTLNIHMRSHTGEKKYKCRMESCDKRYINIADRRRHEMSVHTQERPHKCSYCQAAFIRKRQLCIHERRHTGDKPFVCPTCGKGFVDGHPLRTHLRSGCCRSASID